MKFEKNLKNEKITFGEYFNRISQTPKDFITKIAEKCDVSKRTVYNWIEGDIIPDQKKQEIVSELLGVPAKYLFKQWELVDNTK